MALRSSPRRSATAEVGDAVDVAELLRDGRRFESPSASLIAAAEGLERRGILRLERCVFVRCNDPRGTAARPSSRHCRGKIYVDERLDEAGHEVRCDVCERPVFPNRRGMRRHNELCTHVDPEGVTRFVAAEAARAGRDVKRLADGVWRIDLGTAEVFVCVVDCCPDDPYLDRAWAKTRVVCYVAADSVRLRTGFLNEEWVRRAALADLIRGTVELTDLVQRIAEAGPPKNISEPTVHVYAHRASPGVPPRAAVEPRRKQFLVEVGPGTVRIEGVTVVAPTADSLFDIFSILWERFLADLRECRKPESHTWLKVAEIADRLGAIRAKHFADVGSVRKGINRLQLEIETALKKGPGLAVSRTGVIESGAATGEDDVTGYRLNPRTVLLRPFQPPPA
ncbi:MAG: hypothetical protein HMLKMBBP_01892 [Planctomycetes bacterium]|nr:hypothetical protein [Planctomycetota bacterium]